MNEKKIVTLSILGKNYVISTDEDTKPLYLAADMVDSLLKEIGKQVQSNNEGKIAVLAALKLACDLLKLQASNDFKNKNVLDVISLIDKELGYSSQK